MFDNDGLLLHTEPCWTLAQQEFFRSYGRTFDLADKQALVGTSPRTSAPILQRLLSGADSGERLSDQMYSPALTEIAAGASPRPGAVELVARLQSAGLPLAVASNAPRRHLLAGLQRVGLLDAFDVVLGVDDVAGSQPGARPLPAPASGCGWLRPGRGALPDRRCKQPRPAPCTGATRCRRAAPPPRSAWAQALAAGQLVLRHQVQHRHGASGRRPIAHAEGLPAQHSLELRFAIGTGTVASCDGAGYCLVRRRNTREEDLGFALIAISCAHIPPCRNSAGARTARAGHPLGARS